MTARTAETLIADLRTAMNGDLAPFSEGLLSAAPENSIQFEDLLSSRQCDDIMEWLETRLGARPDRRAAFSIWASWHFRSVLPPIIAANVLFDVSPRLDPNEIRFVVSPDRRLERIVIPTPLDDVLGEDGIPRFSALVGTYLAPLIDRFAARTGLTRRVLWSNAGNVFEGFVRMLEPVARQRPGLAAARRLLATANRPDGTRNPLYKPVRDVDGKRFRRVCCMRYLFPDGKTCNACPLDIKGADPAKHVS